MDNQDTKKQRLTDLLTTNRIKYRPKGVNLRDVGDDDEAVVFEFDVVGDLDQPSVVSVGMDDDNVMTVFYDNGALSSKRFTALLPQLKKFAVDNDMRFDVDNEDRIGHYMKKRKQAMKDEGKMLGEGWAPLSSQRSVGDHVPQVKIIIEHNRKMGDGEQRFRSINRIFIENTVGERILTPVRETSLAKPFARVIAEGDLPHGQRWQHVEQLVEEYTTIRGFVRATKHQMNEHALVKVGRGHLQTLRETLQKLSGHRGYNGYFESWQPTLTEDNSTPDLSTLVESGEDPRIVEALPILYRLQRSQSSKPIVESREIASLESWADGVIYDHIMEDDEAKKKLTIPAALRKAAGGDWKMSLDDLKKATSGDSTRASSTGLAAHKKKLGLEDWMGENLDQEQIDAGQLGPTEKVGKDGPVGKLVGASESVHSAPALNIKEDSEVDHIIRLADRLRG